MPCQHIGCRLHADGRAAPPPVHSQNGCKAGESPGKPPAKADYIDKVRCCCARTIIVTVPEALLQQCRLPAVRIMLLGCRVPVSVLQHPTTRLTVQIAPAVVQGIQVAVQALPRVRLAVHSRQTTAFDATASRRRVCTCTCTCNDVRQLNDVRWGLMSTRRCRR